MCILVNADAQMHPSRTQQKLSVITGKKIRVDE
ncbi:hypothetical protein CJA_0990 [Cellvibrio japonicus Ueda107]|uniref:Uncharacterized protein n=1 Tax=Cellvibrio japonicus (strain Ueda107) TaxID=498211 RepID=B3PB18_CELJU|nr:hypothetical protein CJA_0990 [Cellvibrio japonicus Ueda107]